MSIEFNPTGLLQQDKEKEGFLSRNLEPQKPRNLLTMVLRGEVINKKETTIGEVETKHNINLVTWKKSPPSSFEFNIILMNASKGPKQEQVHRTLTLHSGSVWPRHQQIGTSCSEMYEGLPSCRHKRKPPRLSTSAFSFQTYMLQV